MQMAFLRRPCSTEAAGSKKTLERGSETRCKNGKKTLQDAGNISFATFKFNHCLQPPPRRLWQVWPLRLMRFFSSFFSPGRQTTYNSSASLKLRLLYERSAQGEKRGSKRGQKLVPIWKGGGGGGGMGPALRRLHVRRPSVLRSFVFATPYNPTFLSQEKKPTRPFFPSPPVRAERRGVD